MTDTELFTEALAILEDARCKLHDIDLRVKWGLRKNRLMAELRERLEK